jgi:NADH-quinone oxidoreductase subunit C
MNVTTICENLKAAFPDAIQEEFLDVVDPWIKVSRESLVELCTYLRDNQDMQFNQLMCLSGVHTKDKELWNVLHVYSSVHRHRIGLKVVMTEEDNHCPSVSCIWATADWHERESYDLVGIIYDNHPDLRRILLEDDWEGHPLRKDYKTPDSYNGMPLS